MTARRDKATELAATVREGIDSDSGDYGTQDKAHAALDALEALATGKASEGRTEAAAVEQAIANAETALTRMRNLVKAGYSVGYAVEFQQRSHGFDILAALRVLADAVEELRGDYEKQREYADEQYRKALAAEAERDRLRATVDDIEKRIDPEREAETTRLARQVADLEAALEQVATYRALDGLTDEGEIARAALIAARSRDPQEGA